MRPTLSWEKIIFNQIFDIAISQTEGDSTGTWTHSSNVIGLSEDKWELDRDYSKIFYTITLMKDHSLI